MVKFFFRLFLILSLLFMVACFKKKPALAKVEYTHPVYTKPKVYWVQPGDSLAKIARRTNLTVASLAATNQLSPPYHIAPGQWLLLKENQTSPGKSYVVATQKKKIHISPSKKMSDKKPVVSKQPHMHHPTLPWMWPTKGQIIGKFQGVQSNHKGINIAGKLGAPIKAALSGSVVYCGSALKGYGNLIILKHQDNYLSAYAHNKQLLVKEGDEIQKGQVIATMGNSDAESVMLHFEIRRHGKPVDPLKLLP